MPRALPPSRDMPRVSPPKRLLAGAHRIARASVGRASSRARRTIRQCGADDFREALAVGRRHRHALRVRPDAALDDRAARIGRAVSVIVAGHSQGWPRSPRLANVLLRGGARTWRVGQIRPTDFTARRGRAHRAAASDPRCAARLRDRCVDDHGARVARCVDRRSVRRRGSVGRRNRGVGERGGVGGSRRLIDGAAARSR